MKIGVIGTGYVGLVSGVCFAELGHEVFCLDNNKNKIDMLHKGEIPIYEPGLSDLLEKNVKQKRLSFSMDKEVLKNVEVVFLAVGTPMQDSGEANLTYLFQSVEECLPFLKEESVLVIKSTVPVGTHLRVKEIVKNNTHKKIFVVSNPEFLKEGAAINDFMKPDRIVIGFEEAKAFETMSEIYRPLVRQGNPILKMTNASAELTKYACNAFLATKISFINEMSQMCDLFGASIDEIRQGMGSDPRIGKAFLYPGPGFGGSCFPKDVSAIIYSAAQKDYQFKLALATNEVNQKQKIYLAQKIYQVMGSKLNGKNFAIWGLTFKANTDDIRESAAIDMINELASKGASFKVYDPCGMDNFKMLTDVDQKKITYFADNYECLDQVDALIILTEWREFQTPDLALMKSKMKSAWIFDGRNLLDVDKVVAQGFQYYGLGKGQSIAD